METKALAIRPQLTPGIWNMIAAVAPAMHKARLFNMASPEQAMAIMLKGHELGLGLTASFEFVQVVEGRPALSPRGMLALIHNSPECAGVQVVDVLDDKKAVIGCTATMKRRNGFEYSVTWTMADAQRAGVIKSGSGWEKYPANMLRWRAIGFCADVVFPDVIGGMKRADELGADLTPDGDVVEARWSVQQPAPAAPAISEPTAPKVEAELNALLAQYGAEKILAASGGRLPTTLDEVRTIAAALEEQPI
jgi:hypothetical protein